MTTRRFLGGEIRAAQAEDGRHYVTLTAIRPFVVDDYGSVWLPDVFDRSLAVRLPVMAWSHDWADPIGVGVEWTRTGDAGPDITFRFDDFAAVPRARQAFAQVSDPKYPTIRDCSVGFSNARRRDPSEEELARWPGCREIIEDADLDEVSLVLRGAVPGAVVASVRSLPEERGPVDREQAGKLILRVATGELDVKEALTQLEALEVSEDGDDAEGDEETQEGADEAEESGQEQTDDLPDPAEVEQILADLDAEADAALASIEV